LPYKGLDKLRRRTADPLILEWAEGLEDKSRTKLYSVIVFWEWVKAKEYFSTAKEMIEDHVRCLQSTDVKTQYRHYEMVKKYIRRKGTGVNDRKIALSCIRGFYGDQHCDLQDFRSSDLRQIFAPDEAEEEAYEDERSKAFSFEELQQLITRLPMPYSAIVCTLFQGAMDMSAFSQFNRRVWRKMKDFTVELDKPGPTRIGWLVRSKTAAKEAAEKGTPTRYYTYISDDAKRLIKQWLNERQRIVQKIKRKGEKEPAALFIVKQKNTNMYVPVTGSRVGANITATAKKLALIPELNVEKKEDEAGTKKEKTKTEEELKAEHRLKSRARYHIHAHELRDLFASQCKPCGVDKDAVEFFLGHEVDRLHYDKTSIYHEEWYRGEYCKLEKVLNIVYSPQQGLKEQVTAVFNRESLIAAGYTESEVEQFDLARMTYAEREELIERRRQQSSSANGTKMAMNGNGKQRVVEMVTLQEWVDRGARFVTQLANGKVVVELPLNAS
jgi:hypothetical protein